MKISEIEVENKKKWLKITDFENIFDVYLDNKQNYHYNLNQTIYFDISEDNLLEYICTTNCAWPLISYQIYGTTRLAWFLMKINKVDTKNIFDKKQPGDIIKYLEREKLQQVISDLNS